ncbi:MAG: hypothetical protein Q7K35_04665 [bacterium]|nr:hypothetical protein [bacterium]
MEDIKPNFIEFKSFGSRVGANYIGITGGGAISFYSGFYKSNNIASYKKCVILYDKALRLVAFKFGGDELGHGAFPLNHNMKNKTAWISGQNFFKLNQELKPLETKGKFEPVIFKDAVRGEVFLIDLNKRKEVRKK